MSTGKGHQMQGRSIQCMCTLLSYRLIVHRLCHSNGTSVIPYSRKYWRESNLAVRSQIAITNVLVDLNLVVWYRITIRIYVNKKFWWILIWRLLRQSANPPNLIPRQIFQLHNNNFYLWYLSVVLRQGNGSASQCTHYCTFARLVLKYIKKMTDFVLHIHN